MKIYQKYIELNVDLHVCNLHMGKLRQDDQELKASLRYLQRLSQRKNRGKKEKM